MTQNTADNRAVAPNKIPIRVEISNFGPLV